MSDIRFTNLMTHWQRLVEEAGPEVQGIFCKLPLSFALADIEQITPRLQQAYESVSQKNLPLRDTFIQMTGGVFLALDPHDCPTKAILENRLDQAIDIILPAEAAPIMTIAS